MKANFYFKRLLLLSIFLAFVVTQTACGALAAPTNTATPVPSDTPLPTATPIPTNTPAPTDTPAPTATSTPDVTATREARATADMQAQIDRIAPELEGFGYDPDSGSLAWVADAPIAMSVSTYLEDKREQITEQAIGDFILVTDVAWRSSSGLAGCSLIFRSGDDMDEGEQYVFPIMRLQNAPAWDIEYYKYGEWQSTLTLGKVQFSPALKDQQDDTNRLALVVHGDQIEPYINGYPQMVVTDGKLTDGQIAFETWQESGSTTCTFTNGWLWELKP
jgi:hypothetical protein